MAFSDDWVFVISDRRAGTIPIRSWHSDEVYAVSPAGSWVPRADLETLLRYEKQVCCGQDGGSMIIKPITAGRPTADQLKDKPGRVPAGLKVETQPQPVVAKSASVLERRDRDVDDTAAGEEVRPARARTTRRKN